MKSNNNVEGWEKEFDELAKYDIGVGSTSKKVRDFIHSLLSRHTADIVGKLQKDIENLETFASDDYTMTGDVKCEKVEAFYKKSDVLTAIQIIKQ